MILGFGLRPSEIGKSISRGKDFGLKIEDFLNLKSKINMNLKSKIPCVDVGRMTNQHQ